MSCSAKPSPAKPSPAHLRCHLPVVDPAQGGEVGGLGAVEAVVEAGVVTIRKCDHELPGFLGDLKHKGKAGDTPQVTHCSGLRTPIKHPH